MRTRPLPNRHAHDLSLFAETVQATLNRNRAKGDLSDMTPAEIIDKIKEEAHELVSALRSESWGRRFSLEIDPQSVEREAADLAVCALAAFIWARGLSAVSGKDLSREEFIGLTMYGEAIGVQVRDRGQVALHVRDDALRSTENFHPVLLEARDVARLRALLNEAERRGAVSEAMSARELEEVEKKAKEATDWASRALPASLGYAEARGYARAYAEDTAKLLAEVRRSHAENAELRQKVRELEGEEVIEHPIVLKASLACAENQRDYYYQIWQQQTAELRERVEKMRQRLALGERRAQGFYEDGSDSQTRGGGGMSELSLRDRILRWLSRRAYESGHVNGWNAAKELAFNDGWEQAKETYSKENAELRETLRFYADVRNYWSYCDGVLDDSDVARDGGDRAYAVLFPEQEGEEEGGM